MQILLSSNRQWQDANSVWHISTHDTSGPYLDTDDPYGIDEDSPGTSLGNELRVSVNETFQTTLMFQPTGGHRVPLMSVDWFWNGSATNGPNGWGLSSGDNSHNPLGSPTETYPAWTENIKPLKYIP